MAFETSAWTSLVSMVTTFILHRIDSMEVLVKHFLANTDIVKLELLANLYFRESIRFSKIVERNISVWYVTKSTI